MLLTMQVFYLINMNQFLCNLEDSGSVISFIFSTNKNAVSLTVDQSYLSKMLQVYNCTGSNYHKLLKGLQLSNWSPSELLISVVTIPCLACVFVCLSGFYNTGFGLYYRGFLNGFRAGNQRGKESRKI